MAKKKSNWDILQNRKTKDTNKYRDVYSDQQLERSKIEKTQTFTSRHVITIIVALLVASVIYFVASGLSYGAYSMSAKDPASLVGVEGYDATGKTKPYLGKKNDVNGDKYFALDSKDDGGLIRNDRVYYETPEEVPVPDWYKTLEDEYNKKYEANKEKIDAMISEQKLKNNFSYHMRPSFVNSLGFLISGLLVYGIMYQVMRRNYDAQTILERTDDINQYTNDRHVALPEEILQHPEFDIFPDVGATSNVQVSSMISHFMLENKGLKKVDFSQRAEKDIVDEDGDIEYFKGEVLTDEDGNVIKKQVPLIDMKFGEDLFKASNQPKEVRKYWDVTKIPYNENDQHRERQKGKIKTIAELINKDWQLPWYEPQRPAGFYLIDTAPVNTMVLAITRV